MSDIMLWRTLVSQPIPHHHIVQLYQDAAFLGDVVGLYLKAGLEQREGLVVVATAPHWQLFRRALESQGHDVDEAQACGQLVVLNAEAVLADMMADGMPIAATFDARVRAVIEQARGQDRWTGVRVYGELVNLLWEQGNVPAAFQLETLWNASVVAHQFSLLCAYRMDTFSHEAYGTPLQALWRTHSHVIPVDDERRFEQAVNSAVADVLGISQARIVRTLLDAQPPSGPVMPHAGTMLLWLKEHVPIMANAILLRARRYYAEAQPSSEAMTVEVAP